MRKMRAALGLAALLWVSMAGAQTDEHVRLMPQLGIGGVTCTVFSPDGRYILIGSQEGTASLWDAATGQEIRSFAGQLYTTWAVAFSPDGRSVLTGSDDSTVRQWDAATGQVLRTFVGHSSGVMSVAFSPDGHYVLTGSKDKTARLWDAATGQQLRTFAGHTDVVSSVAFSADGQSVLTGSWDLTARLWDVATGKMLRSFVGHTYLIDSVAFSPDGRTVLTGGRDNTARLWDTTTGQMLHSFVHKSAVGLDEEVETVAYSPDGRTLLTAGMDSARLWDPASGQQIRSFTDKDFMVKTAAFSPDGRTLLTGGWDDIARLWDAASGRQLRSLAGHSFQVSSVAFSPDGHSILTGGWDKIARLWSLASGQQVSSLAGHLKRILSVAFSPDGQYVLTGSDDNTALVWDAATGQALGYLRHPYTVTSVGFSPDGRYFLTGDTDKLARIWDTTNGQVLRSFEANPSLVFSVAFSPDGRSVLTGGNDDTARLWDAATGKQIRSFVQHTTDVNSVAFSPDGRSVLTGGFDRNAYLWDVATGQQLRSFAGHTAEIRSVAFSPDGRYVLTGSFDNTARLWDAASGQLVHTLVGHAGSVESVAFSPDGRYVMTGSRDTTTRLWDAGSGKELAALVSLDSGGWFVVDPDGRFDSSNLDSGAPLLWIADSEPFRALPLEIFMRDYYTPGLLARVMRGEKLPDVRSIAEIKNRVQPEVKVVRVASSVSRQGRVDVVVHAASVTNEKSVKSGLQDLRLFRDGQMVANGYREGVLQSGDFVFRNVMLKGDAKKVTFTAYAFSSERIKSATASLEYEVKVPVNAEVKRRAFLLQVGVNHTLARGCELKYSVNDAETMSAVLSEKLRAQGFEVVPVKLESGAEGVHPAHDDGTVMNGAPSKEEIRRQLERIAAKATPDDVFFMSFSGHGFSAAGGAFYVLPSSLQGDCAHVDDAMLKTAISADELADWLRPIDAGEMTLILDACYSAESVQAGDFKPGPMGSRGLGQMAYDKRMRVLAASQSDAVAHEYDYLHQGLLSYVLVKDGLEKDRADWKPKDGKITVGEWLSYAAAAVPEFKPSAPTGESKGTTIEKTVAGAKVAGQVPALFDFSREDTLVLAK